MKLVQIWESFTPKYPGSSPGFTTNYMNVSDHPSICWASVSLSTVKEIKTIKEHVTFCAVSYMVLHRKVKNHSYILFSNINGLLLRHYSFHTEVFRNILNYVIKNVSLVSATPTSFLTPTKGHRSLPF